MKQGTTEPIIDARELPDRSERRFDVAVVGGGPTGIVIAERLAASGLSVGLLEGGGTLPGAEAQRLMRGSVKPGGGYAALDVSRVRALGGSSALWGGWCVPLRASDFHSHSWVPNSGWPITLDDVLPFHQPAARLLGLGSDQFDFKQWEGQLGAAPSVKGFEAVAIQTSPVQNFATRPGALSEPNLTTIVGANVTEVQLDSGGTAVVGLSARTLTGKRMQIHADRFVLAAGGIENARLMLASRAVAAEGVGNSHGLVGRFFMDHIHVPIAYVEIPNNGLDDFFDERRVGQQGQMDRPRVRGFLNPTPAALEEDRLPDCNISLRKYSHQLHGWPMMHWPAPVAMRMLAVSESVSRLNHGPQIREVLRRVWRGVTLLRKAGRDLTVHSRTNANIRCLSIRAEQYPRAERRVRLSERRDELGMPTVELDWDVSADERAALLQRLDTVADSFADAGVGRVLEPIPGWEDLIVGGPHHIGATRMSDRPETGVVDRDCRVHGIENLYVAGSSVFATGGWVNPTFSVVALALRLASHLASEGGT